MIIKKVCLFVKKTKQFLIEHNIKFQDRDIVLEKLSVEELNKLIIKSNKDINKFFNTSGLKYRALNLKDKLPNLSYEEKLELLSTDGMLVKRPILEGTDFVLVGFKESEYNNIC